MLPPKQEITWNLLVTYVSHYCSIIITHQISNAQQLLKVFCHWIMLHGHEDSVENNADSDSEVNKWVHDDGVQQLF